MTRSRIKKTIKARAGDLLPCPSNPRTHGDDQRDVVDKILREFGSTDYLKTFEVPKKDLARFELGDDVWEFFAEKYGTKPLMLFDGHLRQELDPDDEVDVLVTDLKVDEALRLIGLFDWSGSLAGYDRDLLTKLVEESAGVSDTLDELLAETADAFDLVFETDDAEASSSAFADLEGDDDTEEESVVDDYVDFKFGDYRGRIAKSVYRSFEIAYRAAKSESGEAMMTDVLTKWLGIEGDSESDEPTASLDSPPVVVSHGDYLVVRDDLIAGGTKRRAVEPFIRDCDAKRIVYGGVNIFGKAQEALAYACRDHDKTAVLFLAARKKKHPHTIAAEAAGAEIHEVPNGMLTVTEARAREYAEAHDDAVVFPCGFWHEEIIEEIARVARQIEEPERFWAIVASGTLATGLIRAWPNAKPMLVSTGKKIEPDDFPNATVFMAPQKYNQKAKKLPPWPAIAEYDAKLWQFVEEHGQPNDLIWSVS